MNSQMKALIVWLLGAMFQLEKGEFITSNCWTSRITILFVYIHRSLLVELNLISHNHTETLGISSQRENYVTSHLSGHHLFTESDWNRDTSWWLLTFEYISQKTRKIMSRFIQPKIEASIFLTVTRLCECKTIINHNSSDC